MASIRKEFFVAASAAHVWDALRDFGAVHRRVAPGFVTDLRLEEGARIVTFANGNVARELLVDADDERMRLVYAIIATRFVAHSASVQAFAEDADRCRVVWITDMLPNELTGYVSGQMDAAVKIMRETLARDTAEVVGGG
jgi:hypothetical protein